MPETIKDKKESILGSGKVYFMKFTGTLPTNAEIEKDENLLGLIQGGAKVSYTPTYYESEDDLGLEQIEMLTKEDVKFTTGLMTWAPNVLPVLCATARVTEENGVCEVKIGGLSNYDDSNYVIRFVHASKPFRATIVGKNKGGLEFAFQKDKETIIDAEITAKSMDNTGTKLILTKGEPAVAAPTASEPAGAVASGTNVSLSCATTGAKIYYTTDGSTPTTSSTEYTTAIEITSAMTIKAIAVKDGKTSSVAEFAYTLS